MINSKQSQSASKNSSMQAAQLGAGQQMKKEPGMGGQLTSAPGQMQHQ